MFGQTGTAKMTAVRCSRLRQGQRCERLSEKQKDERGEWSCATPANESTSCRMKRNTRRSGARQGSRRQQLQLQRKRCQLQRRSIAEGSMPVPARASRLHNVNRKSELNTGLCTAAERSSTCDCVRCPRHISAISSISKTGP
jgi:hypothetical protein